MIYHLKLSYGVKWQKKYFNFDEDLFIGIVYIPPENSSREKKINTDHFQALKDIIKQINSERIILLGDFNARTNNLDDVLKGDKNEENLDHFDFFSKIQTNRCNQDQSKNKYGHLLTEFCIATRSYITNGRTMGDLQGKYTCHELKGSSTVDYAVVNETLTNTIQSFQVLDPNTGSDHSAILLNLSIQSIPNPAKNNDKKLPTKLSGMTKPK